MESSDSQSHHTLNDEQFAILVSVAREEFGVALTRTQFNDVMLRLFEHIPGFETLSHKHSVRYLNILGSKYRQAILANKHGLPLDRTRFSTTHRRPQCSTAESCCRRSHSRRSARCESALLISDGPANRLRRAERGSSACRGYRGYSGHNACSGSPSSGPIEVLATVADPRDRARIRIDDRKCIPSRRSMDGQDGRAVTYAARFPPFR
jgi:hypothetical protein